MDEEDLEQQDSGDEEPYDGQDDEEEGSQENVDGEKNYELESIKIKASRDRLEHRARNNKVNTSQMNLKKPEQKPVKIIQKKPKNKDDKDSQNNSPIGIQYVEKPEYTGKMGQKFMNRAQIFQAVKRARLRSLNLNNDLAVSNFGSKQNDYAKFQPYFNEVTAFTAKNSAQQQMLGTEKKASTSRHRDQGRSTSARSRKKSSKRKQILLKKHADKKDIINVTKAKIKITAVDGDQNMYLKKEKKRNELSFMNSSRSNSPSKEVLEDIKKHGQSDSILGGTKSFDIRIATKFGDFSHSTIGNQETGPGQYLLPPLVAVEKRALSSLRNSPRHSLGLPYTKNRPYHKENSKDYYGRDSPAASTYRPNSQLVKEQLPSYSQSKFERFHKPSSIVKLRSNLPSQYQSIETTLQVPRHDLMGLGKRFSYNTGKLDDTTPGPGMYEQNSYSINEFAKRSMKSSRSNPKMVFGVERAAQDKLHYHGMEKHFMGRYGADVGTYEMPKQIGSRSLASNKSISVSKSDRGLQPLNEDQIRSKSKLSGYANVGLGPGSYDYDHTLEKSMFRNTKRFALQSSPRVTDLNKWTVPQNTIYHI